MDPLANGDFAQLMCNIFDHSKTIASVGIFIDSTLLERIRVLYAGSEDDIYVVRLALPSVCAQ